MPPSTRSESFAVGPHPAGTSAEDALAALVAELASLPSQVAAAVSDGDEDLIVRLGARELVLRARVPRRSVR